MNQEEIHRWVVLLCPESVLALTIYLGLKLASQQVLLHPNLQMDQIGRMNVRRIQEGGYFLQEGALVACMERCTCGWVLSRWRAALVVCAFYKQDCTCGVYFLQGGLHLWCVLSTRWTALVVCAFYKEDCTCGVCFLQGGLHC